jgi:hypothetical protein
MGDADSCLTKPWVETHGNRVVGVPPKHPKRSVGFLGEFHTATPKKKHRYAIVQMSIGTTITGGHFFGVVYFWAT